MSSEVRGARRTIATLAVALATLGALEVLARTCTAGVGDLEPDVVRAANVHIFPKTASQMLAIDGAAKKVLLIGNSHTYALPGLKKGEPLRADPGKSLVDEIGRRIDEAHPDVQLYRLAYPNMLPFEMLVRTLQLEARGFTPDVVVIGITWRNLARDRELRAQVRSALYNPVDAPSMRSQLAQLVPTPELLEAFDADARLEAAARVAADNAPASDHIEDALVDTASRHVTLLGRNAELRARLYRSFAYAIDSALAKGEGAPSYDVVASDLAFNLECMRVLFASWQAHGVHVLVYAAPERADLPPLADPAMRDDVLQRLFGDARRRGFATFDASHVVPDELWGFEMETPDRSHFTEAGHRLLAAALVESGQQQGTFLPLDSRPGVGP